MKKRRKYNRRKKKKVNKGFIVFCLFVGLSIAYLLLTRFDMMNIIKWAIN